MARSATLLVAVGWIFFYNPALAATVRFATVHFGPSFGDVVGNRARLVALSEEAAVHGAKVIVHTEMATSGYAYFSRAEIASVAETVPGPTTSALGAIAKKYGVYIVVGLPEFDADTNRYFNAAVLIGPDGEVAGIYRKRSTLLEASYNSVVSELVPIFATPYGRVGVVICADLFYSQIPRIAAVEGADVLLAPANVGVETDFLRVRAVENDMAIIVANRYGKEGQGSKLTSFSQDTFAIPSPFPYDFSFGSHSAVVSHDGKVLVDLAQNEDQIGYADVEIPSEHVFPVVRRPTLYSLIGQDTLEPYTERQMGLPRAGRFTVAAINPAERSVSGVTSAINAILERDAFGPSPLRLVVLPEGLFDIYDASVMSAIATLAVSNNIDIVVPFARKDAASATPISVLVTPEASDGQPPVYSRTHRRRNDPITVADKFLVVDRDYGRIALLDYEDLLAPETSVVMAKMGVDVVAVSADDSDELGTALWTARSGDYLHVVVANRQGKQGVYAGGYRSNPPFIEDDEHAVFSLDSGDVRDKKEPRNLDVTPLLMKCGPHNC